LLMPETAAVVRSASRWHLHQANPEPTACIM